MISGQTRVPLIPGEDESETGAGSGRLLLGITSPSGWPLLSLRLPGNYPRLTKAAIQAGSITRKQV